jgi:PTS system ascorbate-specific IIA component
MVGILIVAHGAFGETLIHCASHVLGRRPLLVSQIGVTVHDEPEAVYVQATGLVRQLDRGAGILVMTDMLGATPSNIAQRLLRPSRIEGVAGVNLPMLIRALTYREEPLPNVVAKAMSGGCEGVVHMMVERPNAASRS